MIKNTILVLVSFSFAFLASEILLRVIDFEYTPLKIEIVNEAKGGGDWRYYHAFSDDYFTYDSNLIWRPKKDYLVFNSHGYRADEFDFEKKSNEFRIFAIGDSNTLGSAGGKRAPNWPMYLEQIIENSGGKAIVVNAGVYGYSSFQGLRRFREALSFQPDMVLISFGANDAHQVLFSDKEFIKSREKLSSILLKSKVGLLILATLDRFIENDEVELQPRVSLKEYKKNLEKIIRISNENDIKCILLTRPFIGESPYEKWWKNYAPMYNAATMEIGEKNGILTLDVYSYFKDKEEYFNDESHFTGRGHMVAAALIYNQIAPLLNSSLKPVNFEENFDSYFQMLDNDFNDYFNRTKILKPLEIPYNLRNFNHDAKWTKGDSKIAVKYKLKPEDEFLVLNTFDYHPYRDNVKKLKLRIFLDELELTFSHRESNSYYFLLNDKLEQFSEIQVVSSTFVPKKLGLGNDNRTLGIAIDSLQIK